VSTFSFVFDDCFYSSTKKRREKCHKRHYVVMFIVFYSSELDYVWYYFCVFFLLTNRTHSQACVFLLAYTWIRRQTARTSLSTYTTYTCFFLRWESPFVHWQHCVLREHSLSFRNQNERERERERAKRGHNSIVMSTVVCMYLECYYSSVVRWLVK
jgi:hypothetical protein